MGKANKFDWDLLEKFIQITVFFMMFGCDFKELTIMITVFNFHFQGDFQEKWEPFPDFFIMLSCISLHFWIFDYVLGFFIHIFS